MPSFLGVRVTTDFYQISWTLLATVNFKPPPPLTFQIFISESNHIFTLASEQSCFLSLLIQGNLTTDKDKGCTIKWSHKKARITLWAKVTEPSSQTMGTSAKSFDLINVSTECNRIWYNILSLAWADFFRCSSVEGSCSTDLSGLNIITLRQIAVDDSLPPDVYIARIANAVQVTIWL